MKEMIEEAIADALKTLGIEGVNFAVDHPTDKNTNADYFSNVALVVAGKVNQSPKTIAEQLSLALAGVVLNVAKIEVAGPGFLNFYLNRSFFTTKLNDILSQGDIWGRNDSWAGKRVLVEYTDPNPFKEFHIGHLFTNAVGESIARLFMMNGADTKRVNYQGDVGLHVAHAIWGMQKLGLTPSSTFSAKDLGKAYALGATTYKVDEQAIVEIRDINKKVYSREDETINALYDTGRKVSLAYFETVYAIADTQFDEYFFESEAGPKGKELVLSNPDIFPESDGARIYNGEARGLHTRVFLNKEGLPTYEAKELALAKLKDERFQGYDHSVISTANEINEYFKVLLSAMGEVYPDLALKTEHIGHGMVRLSTGKMSSRTGDVIPAIDFIEEVAEAVKEKTTKDNHQLATDIAIAAIKYATLKGSILQDSIFDKEKALSFEGDSGPYLQYTFARIHSVLAKAIEAGVHGSTQLPPHEAHEVEKIVYQFPEVIAIALAERAPHKVTTYLTELAGAFNSFYAVEKIADATDEYAPYKVALAKAVAITLKNGLWTLGIKTPEKM
ncbi:MAG: arginine--tRNA ligase [Candidatus Pacebacteria bacterium]|nr:arginine--tRNA ligase [Candidatus Paceibacterota bacterium]